ncbi:hypothetical protein THC_0682 [Caldimicrobium thiodismutans]|uniref:Lcl C-terminal domain-containing protein n=1 Tax=Caldimicrobium thiodismutans TaxID=1653476 RepID=A0A0U5AML9_9BACT|nr:DUF1566 domain-containing protein [Caldimicrobium thiodismutans]BAU23074.1 hypothetical protein THC_0682 [Caldimicrobium thiodismutans]
MILATGQNKCYDSDGREIPCYKSGQDGEFQLGLKLDLRFKIYNDYIILDVLTGLYWPKRANLFEFPMTWEEAFLAIKKLNEENFLGFSDWRLPNRRELRSLCYLQAKNPVLPPDHPFEEIFHGWYWTSTTAAINPRYAWNVNFGGGRMFYSHKEDERMVWPVRGSFNFPVTGQISCYDTKGQKIPCENTGQDGELQNGISSPEPRFEVNGEIVKDNLTGLIWAKRADLANGLITWEEAFEVINELNQKSFAGFSDWRLPNINEFESLVDAEYHSPALPLNHPFEEVREFYWSSTTSFYDPLWAWALYLEKGAVGIGLKRGPHFYVWAVRGKVKDIK